jgi:outer membrane protein OmpA-like peptidoglycan-associated protein
MKFKHVAGLSAVLALGACASTPQPNADLEQARSAVSTAESDPNVQKYAALDLDAAKKDLAVAENAYQNRNEAQIAQPAYMATQNARIAEAHAAAKADDAHVATGQQQRDQIVLAARTREVQDAQNQAANARQEAHAANDEAARAQAELEQMKAQATPRGTVITLGDVLFDTGSSHLKPGGARKLDQLVAFLNEHPDRRVQVDGFTDSVGSDSYNEELSQHRADSVKQALMERGVDSSRIGAEGYGKAFPVASNTDSGGRQLNRRVEVVIGNENGAPVAPRS